MRLDKKDKAILYKLDFNARASFASLARELKISKDSLIYRIKRLKEKKIITGYYFIPNISKLGLISYKVMLKYQNLSKKKEQELLDGLNNTKQVGWIVKTEGVYDLMFIVWAKDEIEFDLVWTNVLDKYSKYFYERDVVIIIENHINKKEYLANNNTINNKEVFYKEKSSNECDKTDIKILNELSKNARVSSIELSKKLKYTPEAIAYRIKQLIKKQIILTFRPKIELNKIGYVYYNVLIRIKDFSIIPKLFSYAKQHKNITYYVKYLGKYDIGLDIEVESQDKFREIIEDIRIIFGVNIINYDFVRIIDELKITYGFN